MRHTPVGEPTTDLVTKFGGQLRPEGEHARWDGGDNALVVQPGPAPAAVDTIAQATGPTITTPRHDGPGRYRAHWRKVLQEYAVELEPGPDPETWSDDVIEDRHGDWNKVGGTACELGDGAEAYAFVGRDGRGAWLWQCH
jgi:hypothetical protein